MRSQRSKACDIPKKVKDAVWERDRRRCILCGSPEAMPNSHYVKRSAGGLGIEENVTTMCLRCHEAFDGPRRDELMPRVRRYLQSRYPSWDEKKLVYRKYG